MKSKNFLELVKTRRSVRNFKEQQVSQRIIRGALEAARWAPSGLNNQPWRFMILHSKLKNTLAEYTKYSQVIRRADKLILVFLDKNKSYNYKKDIMAIGAAIQNMLLYLWVEAIGSCWLGEILNQAKQVESRLEVEASLELAAVIALGVPQNNLPLKARIPLSQLTL